MQEVEIIVAGIAGRMGMQIAQAAYHGEGASLAGGFDRPEAPQIGTDIGPLIGKPTMNIAVTAGPVLKAGQVLIDFTAPAATLAFIKEAEKAGAAMVIGTTGFSPEQEEQITAASQKIAVVRSGNMSLGVNLLAMLVEKAAKALGDRYDIEVFEGHHRHKVDAPSGTALMLGEAAARGRGVDLASKAVRGRDGIGEPRRTGDIGFSVLRGGGIIGDHSAHFVGEREILTLSHRALDRQLFADGAIAAAKWVATRPPGLYGMADVLGGLV